MSEVIKKTCRVCGHHMVLADASQYEEGSTVSRQCAMCGATLDFHIPERPKEAPAAEKTPSAEKESSPAAESPSPKTEAASQRQQPPPVPPSHMPPPPPPGSTRQHMQDWRKYAELHVEEGRAYEGRKSNKAMNFFIALAAVCAVACVVVLIVVNHRPSVKGTAETAIESMEMDEGYEEEIYNGNALEAMMDSAVTQRYKGSSVKVYAGELYGEKVKWPVRLAIKTDGGKKVFSHEAYFYNQTSNITLKLKAFSEGHWVCLTGKSGETPLRIKLKYNRRSGVWEGTSTSATTYQIKLSPSRSPFK